MKINEIITEKESPYANLPYKPLEVTVTDREPEQGPATPSGKKGSYNNPDDVADALKDIDDPGIEPVAVVPVVAGLRKAQAAASALKKVIDALKKPKQPKKKQDKKQKTKNRDPDRFGPGVGSTSSKYQYDPEAGVKAANWFKRNRGTLDK